MTDDQKRGIEIYNEGLVLYRKREFKSAISKFQKANERIPGDGPSETYMHRSKDYIESPPPKDWDGVFVMTTK